jgi:NAD(P)-dependent dehydrogenase (short-subunit alcohol dehydrogenase family)
MKIEQTSAIVTGAASGLGAATAAALADAGAHVYGLDLAGSIENAVSRSGVSFLPVDVTDGDGVVRAVDQVAALAGSAQPLRIAVNCAGVGAASRILSKTGIHDLALYARIININLVGTFNVLAAAAAKIAEADELEDGQRGVIVNTASVAAYDGQIGQAAYASSKGGVVGLTLPAARDLAQYGIRVNTIAPGIVETPMLAGVNAEFRDALAAGVPFPRRLARPDEYAQMVLNIVGHDYLNGETIRMDGALRMAPR